MLEQAPVQAFLALHPAALHDLVGIVARVADVHWHDGIRVLGTRLLPRLQELVAARDAERRMGSPSPSDSMSAASSVQSLVTSPPHSELASTPDSGVALLDTMGVAGSPPAMLAHKTETADPAVRVGRLFSPAGFSTEA